MRDAYDGRIAILADLAQRTDKAVLNAIDEAMEGEPARERLFDVLYSRLEALEDHRPALRRLAGAVLRDPVLALELNRIVTGSMAWMLSAAGIDHTGPGSLVRTQGLALVWGQVMRVWLDDDEPGHARTMAELDKRLRQAERSIIRLERLRGLFPGRRGRRQAGRAETPADAEA